MKPFLKGIQLVLLIGSAGRILLALDPYVVMHQVLSKDDLPRLLNVIDFNEQDRIHPNAIQPFSGDFNRNGRLELAVTGVYQLTDKKRPYFLFIAEEKVKNKKFRILFYEENDSPVFIHKPGTTGASDPGDQAFSFSYCINCDTGFDVYWDRSKKRFIKRKWTIQEKRFQRSVPIPFRTVAPEQADRALKLVGPLQEVIDYVQKVKDKKGRLGTRVHYADPDGNVDHLWVTIFSRKKGQTHLMGRILVDVKKGEILEKEIR